MKERVNELGILSIYKLGIGDCLSILAKANMRMRVGGSDLSPGMLKVAQNNLQIMASIRVF